MALEWLYLLVLTAVMTIVMGRALLAIQIRRQYRYNIRSIRRTFDHIIDGNEYRAVVLKAYRKLEANLQRYGVIRLERETVRQFLARVPEHLPLDKQALRDLLNVFERARYSEGPCGEEERGAAVNALRAIQYSLEKIILTQEQLAYLAEMAEVGSDPIEPSQATKEQMALWVVAPFVAGPVRVEAEPGGKYRELVPPRDGGRDELLKMLGPAGATADARLPDIHVVRLKDLVGKGDFAGLGRFLLELDGGSAKGWRVRVDPALASYLLEFAQRLSETGRLRHQPVPKDSFVVLLAATVLAIADGRDFLVPDDLKLALYAAGPLVYHANLKDVKKVLDEEIRQVPMPRGPEFMLPAPVLVRGLTVPAV